MAERTINMRRQLAAALLPVPLELEKTKTKLQQQAREFLALPPMLLVSLWGLFNAGVVLLTFATVYTLFVFNPCVPSWMVPPAEVMDSPTRAEDDARDSVLLLVTVWCAVAQAAAAAPALLLAPVTHRRIRRALAYVILAAAVASHCLCASVVGIFPAAPATSSPAYATYHVVGNILSFVAIFFLAVGDVVGFLALLVGSE